MGLKDKFKGLFENSSKDESVPLENETTVEEADNAEFLALADKITSQIFDELQAEETETVGEVQPVLVSEYDAGDVAIEQLVVDEAEMSNYTELNVVEHESLDDITEHLEDAEIIGDIPEEVTF
ncbi:MAG: hypothetical protein CMB29_04380 [Euryarchaeota archaeon]|nr:hypothetical protein [Euryarchaeota archaeon]DAC31452.1 MAG TPA: hypothetical protein D7H81_01345 [Candidatus Poseidoniales archaeon]HII44663.1 hypothetical protein [Candidatus Poseidoniaceae archaeon]|tara:strand:- start:3851 stop:4222 length:372 start_codon:yes stop_codon:yes gene_type:complete